MGRSIFICGECGTGKTLVGAAAGHRIASEVRSAYRILVIGPPHLTRQGKRGSKWSREIKSTIPGATVMHVESPADLLAAHRAMQTSHQPIWVVSSRNALKMGPPFVPQAIFKDIKYQEREPETGDITTKHCEGAMCPTCGRVITDSEGTPVKRKWLASAKRKCPSCDEQLWMSTWRCGSSGVPKREKPLFLPADYIKRKMKFDIGIIDEAHELKGGTTAQGAMLGSVASSCDRLICLTGTLYGGKASDLYYLLWRVCGDRMQALGYEFHTGLDRFVQTYGIRQRIVEREERKSGRVSKRRSGGSIVVEKPGIVPTLFTDLLMDRAAFLSLDELAPHVPNSMLPARPRIEMIRVPLGDTLERPYREMEEAIIAAVKKSSRSGLPNMGLLSAMYSGLDCYPDHPYDWDPITMLVRGDPEDGGGVERETVCEPQDVPNRRFPKDEALVELLKSEVAAGRRCLVYSVHTIKHPVLDRLSEFLKAEKIRHAILDGVPTDRREDWVAEQVAGGIQVILTHPAKVETGLDLLDFPTIIFHSTGTKPFTFRQAGARSWRIGQTQPCRIVAMAYENTMQEMICTLMFSKCRASTRLEGQVLSDLTELSQEMDITDEILNHVKADRKPMITTDAVEIEPERMAAEVEFIDADEIPGMEDMFGLDEFITGGAAVEPAAAKAAKKSSRREINKAIADLDTWANSLFGQHEMDRVVRAAI